jgi:N-acetyl-anhydromuramyl-L-alanine amidase AmpD
MMRLDERGWLFAESGDPRVERLPTVRTSPLHVPTPLGIVWHWTAGRGGPGFAESLARGAQGFRRGVDPAASWHVLIAKDGTIFQSAPFLVGTWHVGRPGNLAGQIVPNVNQFTVGCELENAGRLQEIDGSYYCWPYFSNPTAPAGERQPDRRCLLEPQRVAVVEGDGAFDAFSAAQEESAGRLLAALVARFGWAREVCAYGHVDFDYPRKEDPGPLWRTVVLPRVLERVFGAKDAPQ